MTVIGQDEDQGRAARSKRPTGQGAILLAGSCLPILGSVLLAPVLPRLMEAFATTPGVQVLVPIVLTAPALMIGLLAPVAGRLVDAAGRKRVLVVDDIAVTGETLRLAAQEALRLGASMVKTATLFVHGASHRSDYFVLETDELILNPWDYLVLEDGQFVVNPEYQKELDEIEKGAG